MLLIVSVGNLKQYKDIVALRLIDHIISEQFEQGVNLQKLDNCKVFQYLCSIDLDGEAIEALEDIGEIVLLLLLLMRTLKSCFNNNVSLVAKNAFLKQPDYKRRNAF